MSTQPNDLAASLTRPAPLVAVAAAGAAPPVWILRQMTVGSCVRLAAPSVGQGTIEGRVVAVHEKTLTVEIDARGPLSPPPGAGPSEPSGAEKRWLWFC